MTISVRAFGIAWYRPEDYSAILRIMSDRDVLPSTFAIWEAKAKKIEQQLRLDGHVTVRAVIDPETFPNWCRARGLNIDAKARMQFADAIAYEQVRSTH